MARTARFDAPKALHHVMLRGIERRPIFHDDADRSEFLDRLDRNARETGASCFAWVLVDNHVHAVMRTGHAPLSRMMQCLNTGYARYFNLRHERVGYLFQGRYKSILVEDESYLRTLLAYVHLNPIESGSIDSLDRLAFYPWSGHAALMGRRAARGFQAVTEVLGWFGPELSVARLRLADWMRTAKDRSDADRDKGESETMVSVAATNAAAPFEEPEGTTPPAMDREDRSSSLRGRGWTLDRLIEWVCTSNGIAPESLARGVRTRAVSEARALIGYLAVRDLRLPLNAVSRATGVSPGALCRAVPKGEQCARDRGIALPDSPPKAGP